MSRWSSSNYGWKLCCCGGLLPVLLLKMVFCMVVAASGAAISCTFLGAFYLVKGAPILAWRILHYAKLGLKIRLFLCILFLVPCVAFLPLFIVFCTLIASLFGIVAAWESTMDTSKCFLWGLNEYPGELLEGLRNTKDSLDSVLDDPSWWRQGPPPGELPWDITWCMMLECLFALIFACVVFYPLFLVFVILKLPFLLGKCYYAAWVEFLDQDLAGITGWGCMSILFFIAHFFIPIPVAFVVIGTVIQGLGLALYAVYVAYDFSFVAAVKYLFAALQRWDAQTYFIIRRSWGDSDPAVAEDGRCAACCPYRQCSLLDRCCLFDNDIQDYAKGVIDLV
eukprot:gb/GEZN01010306.1/.p1 GENE.gb/GEZN01010306.1/~~gb/GEZN01010306.1/.p1  ORF type:complete len:337 (-),score=12.53 gb/GEZN01010306.1/:198-1208(-)